MPTPSAQPGILIVEDEGIVALDLEHNLRALGYRIAGLAGTHAEALALTEQTAPDLVLMDIRLAGELDGLAAADEIRRRWRIPVVMLTAYSSQETLLRASSVGAQGYLVKPFRPDELSAAIRIALHQHRVVRGLADKYSWLLTTLDSLNDGVIATDAAGSICYLNGAAQRLTGWTQLEGLGRSIEEIYTVQTPAGKPVAVCQLRTALRRGAPTAKKRFRLCRRGVAETPIEASASPLFQDGQLVGAVTIFCDISERLVQETQRDRRHRILKQQVRTANAALGDTQAELQALSRHLMTAQEDERRQVARELHDDLGQQTALLDMELSRLEALLPRGATETAGEVQQVMAALRARSHGLADGLRGVSHRLHPSVLEDLGLQVALRMLVEEHHRCGEELCFIEPKGLSLPPLPKHTTSALYRIAQEALRNTRKHAPRAPVRLTLSVLRTPPPGELYLSIEDAGPGFELHKVRAGSGLGLLSLKERALSIGGSIEFDSALGHGTRIEVRAPLPTATASGIRPHEQKSAHE